MYRPRLSLYRDFANKDLIVFETTCVGLGALWAELWQFLLPEISCRTCPPVNQELAEEKLCEYQLSPSGECQSRCDGTADGRCFSAGRTFLGAGLWPGCDELAACLRADGGVPGHSAAGPHAGAYRRAGEGIPREPVRSRSRRLGRAEAAAGRRGLSGAAGSGRDGAAGDGPGAEVPT